MSNHSTQKRQYDSFAPHFRIETGNPQLGVAGNICYNLYGYSDSSDVTNIGMMGDGQLQIMADQCITIDGGASVEGGGCCVNIIGDVKVKGTNIVLDATENVEIIAGGKVTIDSAELIATTQNTTRIHARKTRVSGSNLDIDGGTSLTLFTTKGAIKVKRIKARDIDWAQQVFAGTAAAGALGGRGGL